MGSAQEPWEELAAKKQASREESLPKEWKISSELLNSVPRDNHGAQKFMESDIIRKSGVLSEKELGITERYTAVELVKKLAAGELSSVEVTTAFCKRAVIAQQLVNCLTETLFDAALERAKELDDYLKREGKVMGPLHGLPISIKDCFKIKGTPSTIGYVSFLKNPPDDYNSSSVQMFLDAGAVLYVKTNLPQTMMSADSDNNVFGRVLNPWNTNMGAGGSSGGEAALMALRGSVLGLGNDIAGSVRIPPACCGVYGFKPSAERIPTSKETVPVRGGLPGVKHSSGPMGSSVEDMELLFKTVVDGHPERYDSVAIPIPWQQFSESMTIGVLPEDPYYPLHPPMRRTLNNARAKLVEAGYKVVDLKPPNIADAGRMAWQYFTLDPNPIAIGHIAASGEPIIASLRNQLAPDFMDPAPADEEIFEKMRRLFEQRLDYWEEWRKVMQDVDVILAPGGQYTAVPHDTFNVPIYTMLFNYLDYPAVVIPYGKVSKELDPEPFKVPEKSKNANYDPELLDGLPTSIQVVTYRFSDEKCLWAAKVIDKVLKGDIAKAVVARI